MRLKNYVHFLNTYGIGNKNMKGQSYNNIPNMSGCHNGLQSYIYKINNCNLHSGATHFLNLLGVRAVEAISFSVFI